MTKINKLTMEGFKSFQRKTAVPFYEGLTAIVGTNGSGKSNIQEAVQFVLGRRSSELRAERLEQLIFNGGDNRKPSEEAEVTLYLDNSDGNFDDFLEEDVDEITIGRKVNRNGYSTYRFMGNNCKRRKIDDILERAGVDPEGYHVVRQGRITQIVKQSPVERRRSIDRISGISSYEEREEKALEELEQVEDELRELEIKLELKRDRLETLEREKEDAEKYRELEERKRVLQASILEVRKDELENQLDNLSDEGREEIEELEGEVESLDEEIEELEDRLEDVDEEIDESRDQSIVRDIEGIKGKIQRKEDKIESHRSKIKDIEEVLKDYKRIQGSRAGSSRAVKEVLSLDRAGVHGTVGSLIHYNDRFAVALETAAGKRLENIVVDSRDTAIECVNHLKSKGAGRATFLPLDKVSSRNKSRASKEALQLPGAIDFAINLVDYDEEYARAIEHVFGDTIVAEDLESLKEAGRIRAVTLEGDIMRKGGSITGGAKKRKRRSKKGSPSFNPEEKREEKEELEEDIEDLQKEVAELEALLEEKEEEDEEASEISQELKDERKELREEMRELKEERKEKAEELNNLRNKVGRDQKKRARFEAELENVEEDLEEVDDVEDREEGSLKSLKTKRTKTINKMNDLGNVNLRAIEEYDDFREEFEEFEEKVESIRQEKREIEQIIEDIEEKKEEKFINTLEEVNGHFERIFQKLFDGGEAALELDEEGDIDSGLLIRAQPPEKDPHVIDSLSGGEKTLTAIAFLFALQECDPSPFYVMDEIDAALDARNAERLSDLLKDYAERNQFVVISHNNETVRHADRAYGVSMQEGVSKVRSVDLENN